MTGARFYLSLVSVAANVAAAVLLAIEGKPLPALNYFFAAGCGAMVALMADAQG